MASSTGTLDFGRAQFDEHRFGDYVSTGAPGQSPRQSGKTVGYSKKRQRSLTRG